MEADQKNSKLSCHKHFIEHLVCMNQKKHLSFKSSNNVMSSSTTTLYAQQLAHHKRQHYQQITNIPKNTYMPPCQHDHTPRNLRDCSNSKQNDEKSAHMTSKIPKQVKTPGFMWGTLTERKTTGVGKQELQYEDEENKRWEPTSEGMEAPDPQITL
jgi:hypothetical protein